MIEFYTWMELIGMTPVPHPSLRRHTPLYMRIWRARYLYLLLLPGLAYFLIFRYAPMGGLLLAFKKYNARLGILGSKWVGLDHFRRLFITPDALNAIKNTLIISLSRMVFQFPMPIILAILLDEMPAGRCRKLYQTVYTFPHFLSWVVVSTIMINLFSSNGTINIIIEALGGTRISFLAQRSLARPFLYLTANWKEMGWSSIIFIAAISAVDPTLYEAAYIDGAGRWKRIWYVTLPCILSTIVIRFILDIGHIMNSGFDQIFLMKNGVTQSVVDVIDTYVYRITFEATPNYGFSSAVDLFKSVVNFIMLLLSNQIVRQLSGQGLFN